LLVAAANPERRSATLNLLNFFWSVGAVACPFLVAAVAKSGRIAALLPSVAVFAVLVAIGITAMRGNFAEPAPAGEKTSILAIIRSHFRPFVIIAVLFLFYVGVENAFGEWMASYAKSLGTLTLTVALATPSLFYSSLMVGRWLAPALLQIFDDVRLAQGGLLLACAGLSSVYPITISLLSREFTSGKIRSLMFVLSNIGGGLLPWIVGVVSNRFGAVKAGLYAPLLGCLLMYFLYLIKWSDSNPPAYEPGSQSRNPQDLVKGK
jgi:fucose permease